MFFPSLGTRRDTFENWTLWDYLERLPLAQTLLQKERREVSGGRFGAKVLTDTSAGPLLGYPSNPVRGSEGPWGKLDGDPDPRTVCDLLCFHSLETSGGT